MFSDFIWVKENSTTSEFCNDAISLFEQSDQKVVGHVGASQNNLPIINKDIKRSLDLHISDKFEWQVICDFFRSNLVNNVKEYFDYLKTKDILTYFPEQGHLLSDSGFQIQKTCPGEFYKWHNDFTTVNNNSRVLTYIWYLNDVYEDGETEFIDGTKISPREGKFLLFPATWTYLHQGIPPKSETKYICTGWLYFNYGP